MTLLALAVDLRLSGLRARCDYLTSPHWACHRHPYKTRGSYNWSVETGTNILSGGQIFPATHDQRSCPDFAPGLPGLYLAQLHLPCGWTTDASVSDVAISNSQAARLW